MMLNCFQQRIRLGEVPESIERTKDGEIEGKKNQTNHNSSN